MIRPEKLAYINIDMALQLMGGYEQIYLKVVDTFLESEVNLLEKIDAALENNREEARRLVHSCKGNAKNMGSQDLYEIAALFEEAILDDNNDAIDLQRSKFYTIFPKVFHELKQIKEMNT